jgi:energy-converting hydrogenase Eha subunit E
MAIFICRLAKFIGEPFVAKDRIVLLGHGVLSLFLALDRTFAGVTFLACQGAAAIKSQ